MNVLLICSKDIQKSLETMCVRAKNKRVLGTLNQVADNLVECIKSKYKPHCIIWAKGVEINTSKSELELIMEIHENFPYIRIIVNLGNDTDNIYDTLIGNEIYDVVKRTVTDVEFIKLLNEPLTSVEEVDRFNELQHKVVPTKQKKRLVINPVAIIILAVAIGLIAACIFLKNIVAIPNNTANQNATEASGTIEIQTENSTIQEKVTEKHTEYATAATQTVTEKPTKKEQEIATQKPTEKKKSAPEGGGNNSGGSNNNGSSADSSGNTVQPPVQQSEQPVQQVEQPVQQPIQQIEQSVQQIQPVEQPAQQITDDGQIHFDKDNYVVNVGETFDIYVSGLAANNGCNWNLTNNAIAEFVSSDVTKVKLKAKAKGSTVITGTAKSNGATRQVLVTVE